MDTSVTILLQTLWESVDLAIFKESWVLGMVAILTLLLRAKIGFVKALFLTPLSVLLEQSVYCTMEVTPQSYLATGLFLLTTIGLVFSLIYILFIKNNYREVG